MMDEDLGPGRVAWMRCSGWWRGGSSGRSRGGGRGRMCAGCWRRWRGRTGGRWPRRPGTPRRTGCSGCCNAATWDADGVRDDVRGYVVEHLGDAGGVLIVDETGFLKKGSKSAGVQRQYSGTAGRIENCQLGVFLAYATSRAGADRPRAVPAQVVDRGPGRAAARPAVPDEVGFATKTDAGAERCSAGRWTPGCPPAWVTADEAYGQDYQLPRPGSSSAASATSSRCPATSPGPRRPSTPAHPVAGRDGPLTASPGTPQAWKRRCAGDGAKGPRLYDWAVASLPRLRPCTRRAGHLAAGPPPDLTEPPARANRNWPTTCAAAPTRHHRRASWSASPGPAGRSRNASRPPRTRSAWTTTRSAATTPGTGTSPWPCSPTPTSPSPRRSPQKHLLSGLIPLTLGEIRRLLAHLITTIPDRIDLPGMVTWRRRHQHRARDKPTTDAEDRQSTKCGWSTEPQLSADPPPRRSLASDESPTSSSAARPAARPNRRRLRTAQGREREAKPEEPRFYARMQSVTVSNCRVVSATTPSTGPSASVQKERHHQRRALPVPHDHRQLREDDDGFVRADLARGRTTAPALPRRSRWL